MDVCYCLLTHTWRCARSRVWRSRVLWCPLQVAGHRSTPALKINELQSHNFPPCLLDDVSSASREPVEAGHMKTAPAEASRLKIDCSFIPFCLTLMHQLWSGHYPTAGDWNASSSWEGSSKTRSEAALKHPASFTVRFHVAVSQLFNFFFFYSLWFNWSSGGSCCTACDVLNPEPTVFRDDSESDRISPPFDLRSLSRYHRAKADGTEGKLQLPERGRIYSHGEASCSDHVVITIKVIFLKKKKHSFMKKHCAAVRHQRADLSRWGPRDNLPHQQLRRKPF